MSPDATLLSALVAALGVIGLLVKALLDRRRQKNGSGQVTREELRAAVQALTEHLDEKAEYLNEKIDDLKARVDGLHNRRGEFASALDVERLYRRVETLEQQMQRRPG